MRAIEHGFRGVAATGAVVGLLASAEVLRSVAPHADHAGLAELVTAIPFVMCVAVLVRTATRRTRRARAPRVLELGMLALMAASRVGADDIAPAVPVLTEDDAVALALQNNRGVGIAALDVARAEEKIGAARTRRLSSLLRLVA